MVTINKHYEFDEEGAEFEAGKATTRFDVWYLLDCIKESIHPLNYKDIKDEELLKKVETELKSILDSNENLLNNLENY